MSAAFINGVQSKGIGTSLKHYAVNSQETRRMTVSAVVDERTLREIYLTAYEIAVKESQPWTIMCMYNRLNGVYGAENKWLLTDVLRHDFGFEGMIVTDWGAENDRVLGLLAGQNLEMPTSNGDGNRKIYDAVKRGEISEDFLDEMVDGVVDVIMRAKEVLADGKGYNAGEHHAAARKIARREHGASQERRQYPAPEQEGKGRSYWSDGKEAASSGRRQLSCQLYKNRQRI